MTHKQHDTAPPTGVAQQQPTAPQQHIAVGGDVYGATIGEMKGGTINVYPPAPAPEPPSLPPDTEADPPHPPTRRWQGKGIATTGVLLVLWLGLVVWLPERTPAAHTPPATPRESHATTTATGTERTAPPTGILAASAAAVGHSLPTPTRPTTLPALRATANGHGAGAPLADTTSEAAPPTTVPPVLPLAPSITSDAAVGDDDDFGDD